MKIKFICVLVCTLCVVVSQAQKKVIRKAYSNLDYKNKNATLRHNKRGKNACFDYARAGKIKNVLRISFKDSLLFSRIEDTLVYYIDLLQKDTSFYSKKYYDSCFLQILKTTLQNKKSFYYNFPKLGQYIYIVKDNNTFFKIFTWQYSINYLSVLQQGVMQIKVKGDTAVKVVPLFDRSNAIGNRHDTVLRNDNWIGSLYYSIIENVDTRGRVVYTLLGLDENTILSNKKWIEILTFDSNCMPIFGGNYFSFGDDNKIKKIKKIRKNKEKKYMDANVVGQYNENRYFRYSIEYAKNVVASMRFDEELGIIIFDHLVPSDDATKERKYTYYIDGDYEGFRWSNGKWNYIPQVFDYSLRDGQFPREIPLDFDKKDKLKSHIN